MFSVLTKRVLGSCVNMEVRFRLHTAHPHFHINYSDLLSLFLNSITTSQNVQVSKVYKYFCTTLPNSGEVEVTRKCSGGWMLERSTIWGEQNPLWL